MAHHKHVAAWLSGPLVAVLLGASALLGGGPGFALFVSVAGFAFLVGVPLLQFFLLREPQFSGRHWSAAGLAMLVAVVFLAILIFLGMFSFW
jgi:hypothetical protein